MRNDRQLVLSAAVFMVVAVAMITLPTLNDEAPANGSRFGPEALPFSCDFTREGAGPDDMDGRFTLRFDRQGNTPFPHCATLTRGTEARPRPGSETLCFDHRADTPEDLWVDDVGGSMRIRGTDGATYLKRERAPGVNAFGPVSDIAYSGSCGG